jgi:hypothetical protein
VWTHLPDLVPPIRGNNRNNSDSWLSNEIMEWYLFYQFKIIPSTQQMLYIPVEIIQSLQADASAVTNEEVVTHFKKMLHFQRSITTEKVAFMILHSSHWFVVVFDWNRQSIWTFNRQPLTSNQNNIEEGFDEILDWNGNRLWKSIATLLKWTLPKESIPRAFIDGKTLRWQGVCSFFFNNVIYYYDTYFVIIIIIMI